MKTSMYTNAFYSIKHYTNHFKKHLIVLAALIIVPPYTMAIPVKKEVCIYPILDKLPEDLKKEVEMAASYPYHYICSTTKSN